MKALIEHNFQQASLTYAKCDDIQQKASRMLVNQMKFVCPNIIPAKILDVGCGTGNVIEALYDLYPNATYHINDISAAMLTETSKRFADQIHFKKFHGDIECLNIGHSYDLVTYVYSGLMIYLWSLKKSLSILRFLYFLAC